MLCEFTKQRGDELKKRGLSLLEIMVAIAILSTSILVVVSLFPTAMKLTQQIRLQMRGVQLASALAEELCNYDYQFLKNTNFTSWTPTNIEIPPGYMIKRLDGQGGISCTELPNTNNGLIKLDVTVSWYQEAVTTSEEAQQAESAGIKKASITVTRYKAINKQ